MLFGQPTTLTRICDRRSYRLLAVCFDAFALIAAWYLTIEVRVLMNPFMQHQLAREDLRRLATPLAGVLILWALISAWLGLYRSSRRAWIGGSLLRALESDLLFGALAIVFTFFSRGIGTDSFSRSYVLLFVPVSFVMLLVARYALLLAASTLEKKWPSLDRIAVAGNGPHARWVINRIRASNDPVALVGLILPENHSLETAEAGVPVLGKTTCLAELINQERLDRLIIANGCLTPAEFEECTRVSRSMGVIADHELGSAADDLRFSLTVRYGMPIVEMRPAEFTKIQLLVKRACDVTIAAALLSLFSPLLAVVAVLIKLGSKGPVLYKSIRVGKGGRHFKFLKFRSMYQDAPRNHALQTRNEKNGHLFKIKDDPRVTPLGKLLRRYSIDELPQLINVLRGDMSLVGPRPLPAEDLDPDGRSRDFIPWATQRATVLPGITGLWQIRGRSDLGFERMSELDLEYTRNWSLALDFRILLETPFAVLTARGAY